MTGDHHSRIWRAIHIAADHHRIHAADIADQSNKTKQAIDARRTAYAEAAALGVSTDAISKFFAKDPTTIRKAIRAEKEADAGMQPPKVPAPHRPTPPKLPRDKADWTELDWWRAMAHDENIAMRGSR